MEASSVCKLISIEDDIHDVYIKLGWKYIASLEEDNGLWYITIYSKPNNHLNPDGYATKEEAFQAILDWFDE
jgi:hypothetical protein